jgi:hypothetical protein
MVDVVRYDSDKKLRARYRLRHPREIRQVIKAVSIFVDSVSSSKRRCGVAQLRKYATNLNGLW